MNAACKKYTGNEKKEPPKAPRWGSRKEFPKEIRRRARMRGYSVNNSNNNNSTRKNRPILLTNNANLTRVKRPYRIPYGFEQRLPRRGSFFRANMPPARTYPPLPPSPQSMNNTNNRNAVNLFSPRDKRRFKEPTAPQRLTLRQLRGK